MDPDANLLEQLQIAQRIINNRTQPGDAERLAELIMALDAWISGRGFVPERWAR